MVKAGRYRLLPTYFREVHLFDIIHGTNTGGVVPVSKFPAGLRNVEESVCYMSSWTTVLQRAYELVVPYIASRSFGDVTLIDIGCGKGKAALVFAREARRRRIDMRTLGFDFNPHLVEVAHINHGRFSNIDLEFFVGDARHFPVKVLGEENLGYLYNPFSGNMLERMLEQVADSMRTLIYCNPVHLAVAQDFGYAPVARMDSWHPAGQVTVLRRGR